MDKYWKNCNCKGWKENHGVIDSALINHQLRGYGKLKSSFNYCPYCGAKLKENMKKEEKEINSEEDLIQYFEEESKKDPSIKFCVIRK